jgi:ATF/CREB family transcription factor
MSAAAKRDQNGAPLRSQGQQPPPSPQQQQPSATSQPQETPNGATTANPEANPSPASFDPHDNNTANGLSMLAQGRNGAQSTNQFAVTSGAPGHAHPAPVAPQNMNTSPHVSRVNGGSIGSARGMSEVSIASDESEQARPNTRGKGKRNPSPTNARRKADESPAKAPANKKSKTNAAAINDDMDFSDEWSKMKLEEGGSMSKMTDEEKRKNFLERNRYVLQSLIVLY